MPRERLPMRKIRDALRLHAGGLSKRQIAVSLNIGRNHPVKTAVMLLAFAGLLSSSSMAGVRAGGIVGCRRS